MPDCRITVITPTLNQARFLERAICSVIDQQYDNLEYIVIDGGSTDGSAEIIRLYEDDLTYWVSEPDQGQGDAINKAMQRATGDVVMVLDSDDVLLPFTLQRIAKMMSGPRALSWVVGGCRRIDEDDQELGVTESAAPRSLGEFLMHDSGYLPGQASFISRRLLEQHGPFDATMRYAFDYEFACRLLAAGHWPTVIAQPVVGRREHDASKTAVYTLREGEEYLEASGRHAHHLPWHQRQRLWNNLDERRRIYALAQAELKGPAAKRFLMHELIKHPWWLSDQMFRRTLVHGVQHPSPPDIARPAA